MLIQISTPCKREQGGRLVREYCVGMYKGTHVRKHKFYSESSHVHVTPKTRKKKTNQTDQSAAAGLMSRDAMGSDVWRITPKLGPHRYITARNR